MMAAREYGGFIGMRSATHSAGSKVKSCSFESRQPGDEPIALVTSYLHRSVECALIMHAQWVKGAL